jgi:phosphatidylserine decarboxylase
MLRFAPEGVPFFILFGLLTGFVYIMGGRYLLVFPALLTLFMFYFFRDPERTTPEGPGLYTATADGKVLITEKVYEDEYIKRDAMLVSIFMSPMDVHVNRAPTDGTVRFVKYNKGSFKKAFSEEAFKKNENICTVLEEAGTGEMILMRQVAGTIAQKAVCRKKPGDSLKRGERFGMIKFSSRMDIFLPVNVDLKVKPRDRVKAGETVIAVRS